MLFLLFLRCWSSSLWRRQNQRHWCYFGFLSESDTRQLNLLTIPHGLISSTMRSGSRLKLWWRDCPGGVLVRGLLDAEEGEGSEEASS